MKVIPGKVLRWLNKSAPEMMIDSEITLEQLVLLEGWSLHERLRDAPDSTDMDFRLEAWCRAVAPDQSENFDKRLQWDGITKAQAAWAIQVGVSDAPREPAWLPTFQGLRAAAKGPVLYGMYKREHDLPFVDVWLPAVSWALSTLKESCQDIRSSVVLSDSAWLDLADALLQRICGLTENSLWELFSKHRRPGQLLLAQINSFGKGNHEPVHESYDLLVDDLLASGYEALLVEFPVLGRLLAQVTDQWLEASQEMLCRLAQKRGDIEATFAISRNALLNKIQLGISDPHSGGRTVAVLYFSENGQNLQIVYKPKDMQADLTYQSFLNALNEISSLPNLRTLTVLCFDGYGLMEWVEHHTCNDDIALACFYTNAGRLMSILYILGCSDCHHENLIATGNQLVLVDTETLLEPDISDLNRYGSKMDEYVSTLEHLVEDSVLRTGLLPYWIMSGADIKIASDISALGIQPPLPTTKEPGWVELNSDGMMPGLVNKSSILPTSLPVGFASSQRLTDFVDQLCAGFSSQLEELIRLRSELKGPLEAFRGNPRRLVVRATRIYFAIQRQMLEPSALRNSVAHGLKLEQLSRAYLLSHDRPNHWKLLEAEIRQMERLDIPIFNHHIDEESLPLGDTMGNIDGYIRRSGLDAAQERLQKLDAANIEFQQQLIRGVISARHLTRMPDKKMKRCLSNDVASLSTSNLVMGSLDDELVGLEAIHRAEQLYGSAIRDSAGSPEWLGIDLGLDGQSFNFGLIGSSLYSGAAGIAIAFARISISSKIMNGEPWRARAWSCLERLPIFNNSHNNIRLLRYVRDENLGVGGIGGLLLSIQLLQKAGITQAMPLEGMLISQIRQQRLMKDMNLDIICGVSGLIGPLLRSKHPKAVELATMCGERLLDLQTSDGAWPTLRSCRPLTGFSHGAAGISAALVSLAKSTDDLRFTQAAQRALAYERSVYVESQCNWPDFRGSRQAISFMTSWCHGAPGILLSRLILQSVGTDDESLQKELDAARKCSIARIEHLLSVGYVSNCNLCCGAFGVTSLLRLDALLNKRSLPDCVPTIELQMLNAAREFGEFNYFSVNNGAISMPGLFTGKAGTILVLMEISDGLCWLAPVLSAGLLSPDK